MWKGEKKGNYSCNERPKQNDHYDSTKKDDILNFCYASVFCCDRNFPEIKLANSGETLIIST